MAETHGDRDSSIGASRRKDMAVGTSTAGYDQTPSHQPGGRYGRSPTNPASSDDHLRQVKASVGGPILERVLLPRRQRTVRP
jgi:hypothetical protein